MPDNISKLSESVHSAMGALGFAIRPRHNTPYIDSAGAYRPDSIDYRSDCVWGSYSFARNRITLYVNCVPTLVHEMAHAQQDPARFDSYIASHESYREYCNQPLEAEARLIESLSAYIGRDWLPGLLAVTGPRNDVSAIAYYVYRAMVFHEPLPKNIANRKIRNQLKLLVHQYSRS